MRRSGIKPRKPVSSLQQSSSQEILETYIQPLSKYLLSTYCVLGPGGGTSVTKKHPCPHGAYILAREIDKQME